MDLLRQRRRHGCSRFELQLGTNHLGHFALHQPCCCHVTGRVVTVSSTGHRWGAINFADLNWERKRYRRWRAYGSGRLANLLFTAELHALAGPLAQVLATAAHGRDEPSRTQREPVR